MCFEYSRKYKLDPKALPVQDVTKVPEITVELWCKDVNSDTVLFAGTHHHDSVRNELSY